ncbi:DUF819 domain-containing protein [Xanthovirga aplysinae]|uniref:DUF819 family protein n=1 Tax=Xanthovirga aplysinae TaxID=2529853 RepID=UPI0012BC00AB|nr:DUF819 family protein [Xanthovirga aplysinae]MTI32244.1 DUF819 family protein [Xanthovirga aplysinae]
MEPKDLNEPLITNDAVVLGLLFLVLALIFKTSSSSHPFWKKFYTFIPSLLLCYFIPSIFNSMGLISGESSQLYFVTSRYLLPASLVLLTLSIDLKGILDLGYKPLVMFLAGTIGIMLGGPLAIIIVKQFNPELVGGEGANEVWKGLSTIAGSWIGGGANQAAMLEVFGASGGLYSKMIAVDIIVANIWMAFLLFGVGKSLKIDQVFKADSSSVEKLKQKVENYRLSISKIPSTSDTMLVVGIAFVVTAIGHYFADILGPYIEVNFPALKTYSLNSKFFWLVVIATAIGFFLSFTKAKKLEGVGASRIGSVFIYLLVATIGMKMDVMAVFHSPGLFLVGGIWMLVHITILLVTAKIIKAPFFFVAVGSQANVGGAASAPIVAAAFNPALAPVGVLLAVLGYFLGTYGAYLCGLAMQWISA